MMFSGETSRRTLPAAICSGVASLGLLLQTAAAQQEPQRYEYAETRELVALVDDAAKLIATKGDAALDELRAEGSRWRQGESYVFVLDPRGTMLCHPDPALEGEPQLDLKDVDGRPIIRGLIDAATAVPGKPQGWYHYEWPVPGGLLPRWKSSYVRLVSAPDGADFVVGSGMYDDRMERAFVVDLVKAAVGRIEAQGDAAFPLLRVPTGPFLVKDSYVFVIDPAGIDLVNPAFPNLEGRSLLDVEDTQGERPIREMLEVVQSRGSGWVDYMWPKPGESVSTEKSAYVQKAELDDGWLLVGCGVYLADAPKAAPDAAKMSADELAALVREGAAELERRGADAYDDFREQGSKWLRDDTYFFVWTLDGRRTFHAVDPSLEGTDARGAEDAHGRPYARMLLDVASSPSGEGWVHYMYPEPGGIFPAWKSVFAKRVRFPSGQQHVLGAGVYDMQMDEAFVEDVVDRAASLLASQGTEAFDVLRDRKGPFVFMDTYVFVTALDGRELVNPAQPSLEGVNLIDQQDAKGKFVAREYIAAAQKDGAAWVDYHWYRPGSNEPARKHSYVRLVQAGEDAFVVGSGYYRDD